MDNNVNRYDYSGYSWPLDKSQNRRTGPGGLINQIYLVNYLLEILKMNIFKLETLSYVSNALVGQKLDMSKNMKALAIEHDLQYDTDAAVTLIRNGYGPQIIDYLQIRSGSKIPFKCYGMDIQILKEVLNKQPHGLSVVTTTGSQSDQTLESKFKLPVNLPASVYPNARIELKWGTVLSFSLDAADYTIDLSTINGSYIHTDMPVIEQKLVPILESNFSGTKYTDIPAEGRLAFILVLARAYATTFALRDALTSVKMKIENQYWDIDADNMKEFYSEATGQAVLTGVYLLPIPEKPLIGNNSKITWEMDATATDLAIYFGYVSPEQVAEHEQPSIYGGRKAVVKTGGRLRKRSVI